MVGLFECGICFWAGEKFMSEVSSTSKYKIQILESLQNTNLVCYDTVLFVIIQFLQEIILL
jgi:hypothetical protein